MSDDERGARTGHRHAYWRGVGLTCVDVAFLTVTSLALRFIFGHFQWFQRFDVRQSFWAELTATWFAFIPYLLFFRRRKARLAEQAAFREDFRQGRVRRMSLVSRSAVILVSLALVLTGSLIQGPYGLVCLVLGVPALLLFAVEEFNIILRPGDSVITDRHDELLAFFKARTLQVGYSIAILSLITVYLVSLLASRYVSVLLPIVLTISLLAPSLLYNRLDRRAGIDE
jgi:hypothetical protein